MISPSLIMCFQSFELFNKSKALERGHKNISQLTIQQLCESSDEYLLYLAARKEWPNSYDGVIPRSRLNISNLYFAKKNRTCLSYSQLAFEGAQNVLKINHDDMLNGNIPGMIQIIGFSGAAWERITVAD